MSDASSEITEQDIDLCVATVLGAAAATLSDGMDAELIDAIKVGWPDHVSGDALMLGEQITLALATAFGLTADQLFAAALAVTPTTTTT